MVGDLLQGLEKSACVIIRDSILQSGRSLLLCFIKSIGQSVKYHDGFNDSLGWNNSGLLNIHTDVISHIQGCVAADEKIGVVIDSLSPLLIHRPTPYTCQTLHGLMTGRLQGVQVEQIVCLLHSDLHDDTSLALVQHIATTTISVSNAISSDYSITCKSHHKKLSGKVVNVDEHVTISDCLEVTNVAQAKSDASVPTPENLNQNDPAANLTFNLRVSDREKTDRSQLKLPYMIDKEKKDAVLTQTAGTAGAGQIFYQMDDVDDFDEDDPDDDLDI